MIKTHPRVFARRLRTHIEKRGWVWLLIFLVVSLFTHFYHPAVNRTESLPFTLFLIERGERNLSVGDYAAFNPKPDSVDGFELTFVKEIACGPRQRIEAINREIFCDGKKIALAKTHSKRGEPLDVIASGVIPPDHYFMRGTHPDSYDSRYAKFGLIDRCRFSGKAHPLF